MCLGVERRTGVTGAATGEASGRAERSGRAGDETLVGATGGTTGDQARRGEVEAEGEGEGEGPRPSVDKMSMKYEPVNQFKGCNDSYHQQVSVLLLLNGPLGSLRGSSLAIIFVNRCIICREHITYLAYSLFVSHCVGLWIQMSDK